MPLDPFLNLILLDNLLVEVGQCFYLKIEKRLDCIDIGRTSFHGVSDLLQHVSDAGLGILKLILDCLAIEIRQVRNGSDGCENTVVRIRGERGRKEVTIVMRSWPPYAARA